jgi:hypothetical protein
MSEKTKEKTFKPIKKLGRDPNGSLSYEPFTANGNTYHFIRPGDEIGIKKWTEYEKLKIVVGTGQTFAGIVEAFKQITDLAGADKEFAKIRTEVILLADSYRKAILDMSAARYNKAFYLCTIFIYRAGDDPYSWDLNRAESYISDWVAENMSEQDFFLFAMLLIPGFGKVFQDLNAAAAEQAERLAKLSGGTS